jgi:hypothetical protein
LGYDSNPYSVVVADLNKDNRLDIVVVNYSTNKLVILLSNGNESFIEQKYSTGDGSHPCSIAIGDFNNDNKLDIAITNSDTSNIGIFLGYGNVSFSIIRRYSTGYNSSPSSVGIGDKSDIVITNTVNKNILVLSS